MIELVPRGGVCWVAILVRITLWIAAGRVEAVSQYGTI